MQKDISIVGAGLVGSLLACYMAKRGQKVNVYERRSDMRKAGYTGGRSINLALSERGWAALDKIGLRKQVEAIGIPMYGRVIHPVDGDTMFQPYGKDNQAIYSVSRGALNETLVNLAEQNGQVKIHFNHICTDVDFGPNSLEFNDTELHKTVTVTSDVILATDGAFSEVRYKMQRTGHFNLSQQYENYGYKELHIPPTADGGFAIEKNALHIWPRQSFMMIALPNPDGSFTCTLFAPYEGENSLAELKSEKSVEAYFNKFFPDIVPLMPELQQDFFSNPTGSLVTVKCFPWKHNRVCLIGDAAHAIVPFYGQGMNCGFEDVRELDELLGAEENWDTVLSAFEKQRKPNTDAIADLALYNFIEMRDLSGREDFQLRLKIEKRIAAAFPDKFMTLYSMVTFNQTPYFTALNKGKEQNVLLDKIMSLPGIEQKWQDEEVLEIAKEWLEQTAAGKN
jgi:kynurenine 3-monooxygenase